jgi:hypothetical protein
MPLRLQEQVDTVGRASNTSLDGLKEKVRSFMFSLQRSPAKLRAFFQKPIPPISRLVLLLNMIQEMI